MKRHHHFLGQWNAPVCRAWWVLLRPLRHIAFPPPLHREEKRVSGGIWARQLHGASRYLPSAVRQQTGASPSAGRKPGENCLLHTRFSLNRCTPEGNVAGEGLQHTPPSFIRRSAVRLILNCLGGAALFSAISLQRDGSPAELIHSGHPTSALPPQEKTKHHHGRPRNACSVKNPVHTARGSPVATRAE